MNGQLNSNIYNASNSEDIEELQQEIDSLNTAVNDLGSKVDDVNTALNDYKSSNSEKITTKDLKSDSATITDLTSSKITAGTVNADNFNIDTFTASSARIDNITPNAGNAVNISALDVNANNLKISTTETEIKLADTNGSTKLEAGKVTVSNGDNETVIDDESITAKCVTANEIVVDKIVPKKTNPNYYLNIDGNTIIHNCVTKGDGKKGTSSFDTYCQKACFTLNCSGYESSINYNDEGIYSNRCMLKRVGTGSCMKCVPVQDFSTYSFDNICFYQVIDGSDKCSCFSIDGLKTDAVNTKCIEATSSNIQTETVNNLTVNGKLTVASGIDLSSTEIGEIKTENASIDNLTVNCKAIINGDSELNGAVKAGSITVPDGAITAGEVCIGAKGVVIDKDKNAAFADISSSNITAENIDVNTKITASCVEAKDVVSTNNFACNFYPENITIDKDVGNLHYSYQLDTDDEGGVLVDCKTVLPIEGATGVITKYKDTESNTINEDSIVYTNEKNGIKIVSNAEADKTTNTIDFDTGSNVFTVKADETGFSILTDGEKSFGISTDGKVEQTIDNCPNDVRTDNILKANEDGSLYTGCVDILGDASKKYGGWTKTKKENYCDCCLVTNYDTGTVQRCHVSRSLDNGIYDTFCVTIKSGSNTDYRNVCVGHNNQSKWDYYTCCCSYVEDGSTKKFENDYSEHSDNTGFKTFTTRIAKDDKVVSIDTIQNKTCLTKALPTVFERHITNGVTPDCNELAWKVCINDSNLYITNPQKTTDAGCVEDILRVEDGKIYTKCGEFTSGGGSGGFFTDSDFENDCMTGTRTVVDDTITTCMETTKPANGLSCYNFEIDKPTSISFGYGTNCYYNSELDENNYCKQTYVYPKDYCYTNYLNNRIYPSICVERSTKNSSKNTIKEDFEYNVSTGVVKYNNHISNAAGNITSNTTFEGTCDKYTCCVNSCRSTTNVNCCQNAVYRTEPNNIFCCINRIWDQKSNPIYCSDYTCEYCNYTDKNGNFTRYTNQYTVCSTCDMPIINYNNYSCCHAVIDAFICSTEIQTKDVEEGDETEICLGSYNKSTGDWVYCYQRSSGTLCGCSYEYDSGVYETCSDYYPNYDCTSTYTRFFNGDHLNGCMYNTSTNQYDYFDVQNCVNLDTKSIDKQVMIANCYIMVRSQVFDKQTTDLPITNSLVPLAGTINGNGFAFFCKGSDGIKFYDNEFNTVDAGTATSITYISNQGQN